MEDENRVSLLAAMYCEEDEAETSPNGTTSPSQPTTSLKTRKIRVGIVEYEVPSVEYVARLEATVSMQAQRLEQQRHELRRVQHNLRRLHRYLHLKSISSRGSPPEL